MEKFTMNNKFQKLALIGMIISIYEINYAQNIDKNNSNNQALNSISLEREKTKTMIDNVNADKSGRLDNANSLGINLKSLPLKNNENKYSNLSTQINDNSENYFSPIVMGQWPELKALNDTKKIINPLSASISPIMVVSYFSLMVQT